LPWFDDLFYSNNKGTGKISMNVLRNAVQSTKVLGSDMRGWLFDQCSSVLFRILPGRGD
jgi:hypothetical protein